MRSTLLCMLALTGATGVGATTVPNNYTFYVSVAEDPNTYHMLVQMQVTGYTIQVPPVMANASHYAKVFVNVNNVQNTWQTGPNYCPSCNMNYTFPQIDLDYVIDCNGLEDIGDCSMTFLGEVYCTYAGLFVSQGPGGGGGGGTAFVTQRAITLSQNLQEPIGNPPYGWLVIPVCTPKTTPPDFNMTVVFNPKLQPPPPLNSPYYKGRAPCIRPANAGPGTKWICSATFEYLNMTTDQAQAEFAQYGDGHEYNCTNRDNGYSGQPWP